MSRDYGKIYCAFWNDEKVRAFSDDAKLLGAYLLSCSHSNAIGAYLLPDAYIMDDLGWDAPRIKATIGEMAAVGMVRRFTDGRHIVICKYLKWNRPENPNVWKSGARQALKLPMDDPAFEYVRNGFETVLETLPKDLQEALLKPSPNGIANGSRTVAEGLSKQEPQPEPLPEPQPEPEPQPQPSAAAEKSGFNRIVEALGGFEAVRRWTTLRELAAAWMDEADLEFDVLPVLRERVAALGKLPSGPAYFTPAIRDHRDKRLAGANVAAPSSTFAPDPRLVDDKVTGDREHDKWRNRIRIAWLDMGGWDRDWGPKPDEPGCLVPPDLMPAPGVKPSKKPVQQGAPA